MTHTGGGRPVRVPLGGCDCYLIALEDHMRHTGQGRLVGVTFLELGGGFSLRHLEAAAARFAASHPLLGARLQRGFPGCVPHWVADSIPEVVVESHPVGTGVQALAESLLRGAWPGFLRFDCVHAAHGTTVLMSWSHLLFDARGVESALGEIARLAGLEAYVPAVRGSWGVHAPSGTGLFAQLAEIRPFIDRYYELKRSPVLALASPSVRAPLPRCRFLHFTAEETIAVTARIRQATGGIFMTPCFLAAAMRAHAAVLEARGIHRGSLQCAIAAQGRKCGEEEPVFQNQVSQLFFALDLCGLSSLESATRALQGQFADMTKRKTDRAFLIMVNWMRRLPPWLYRRFLRHSASGNITSFFHAHTGAFLPRHATFCGAPILNGWHVPSVSQPPGTGLFFSERGGILTAVLSWRESAFAAGEEELFLARLRADLLGEKGAATPAVS